MIDAPNPRKWCSTVKRAVFGASSSLPSLVSRRGRLIWSAAAKASLISAHFDAKHCRDSLEQPHSSDPSPVLCSVVFRPSAIRSLLLDLDPYGGNDPDGILPLFCNQVAWELAPKLAVIFRHLGTGSSFLAC